MDPISIIVTALATGAAAGLKPTVEKAIKEAYEGIKSVIHRKYNRVNVEVLEKDPASEARQKIMKEDLEKVGAENDEELLKQAKVVLDSIQRYAPEAANAVGVNMEDIKGASLTISKIIAAGTGVNVKKAEVTGDIKIEGVQAGNVKKPLNP